MVNNKNYKLMFSKIRLIIVFSVVLFGIIIFNNPWLNAAKISPSSSLTQNLNTWQEIQGKGVALSLPPGYLGGNPDKDLEQLTEKIAAINSKYTKRIEAIKQNAGLISLLAFDSSTKNPGLITNVNITKDAKTEILTLPEYLDYSIKQLPAIYRVKSQENLTLGNNQAAKIILELAEEKRKIKQLVYIISNQNNFWIVTYSTTAEEFAQKSSDFEQSIATLKISENS